MNRQTPSSNAIPIVLLGLVFAVSHTLYAQTNTGSILGTVIASSGAIIPGAEVTLLNEATNDHRSTVSSANGDYTFASLEPGQFTVTVVMASFRREVKKGVVLRLNQKARIDFTLVLA